MIYWLSIPIPVPTLGMVAWWLVIGCFFEMWLISRSLFNRRAGACPIIAKATPGWGLLLVSTTIIGWPVLLSMFVASRLTPDTSTTKTWTVRRSSPL